MAGIKRGDKRGAEKIKQLYGEDFFRRAGRAGGLKGKGHKFAHGKVDPRAAGAKGGAKGKRGHVFDGYDEDGNPVWKKKED